MEQIPRSVSFKLPPRQLLIRRLFAEMGMASPESQFTHLISNIRALYPDFAYLHVVEPRVDGSVDRATIPPSQTAERDALHALWSPKPLVSAGGHDRATGLDTAQHTGVLVAYGRLFISNVSGELYLNIATNLTRLFCAAGLGAKTEGGPAIGQGRSGNILYSS